MNPTISTLQKAEKDLTVDFGVDKVKEAMQFLFTNFGDTYKLNNKIEGFNQYEFTYYDGILIILFSVSLSAVEGDKTRLQISNTNATGGTSSNAILAGKIAEFLTVLSKVLAGATKEEIKKEIKSNKTWGATIVLFIVILVVLYLVLK